MTPVAMMPPQSTNALIRPISLRWPAQTCEPDHPFPPAHHSSIACHCLSRAPKSLALWRWSSYELLLLAIISPQSFLFIRAEVPNQTREPRVLFSSSTTRESMALISSARVAHTQRCLHCVRIQRHLAEASPDGSHDTGFVL